MFFLKQKGLFPLVLFVGSNHIDVAVISQEHLSWGDKQLYLNPMRKGTVDFEGAPYLQVTSDSELEATLSKQKTL